MKPSPESAESLFARALELPAAGRPAFLAQACGGDAALRAQVEALLRAHDAAGDLLNTAPGAAVRAALAKQADDEQPGRLIGRYKLLQKIGEGGCGVVYMAEQQEPVVRRVALKVIKLGMDTKEVIARFEAERQALALMDHPNIARVYDAGATEKGRPFFVMELVRGVRITDYCDLHNLSTAERLHLFTQVCHAIQHAHQKNVVHRDIKPSNVLVTVIDGVAVPKVIDFGIAKAAQGRLVDRTLFTAFEQFIGTPAYMSPEQAELSGVEIDARSDIYSLGVLLYELLTGRPPFEPQDLWQAGLDAMRRRIREVEPPRPSARLSTLEADALSLTALHRNVVASRLIHSVRGDLDWIAMKCLEKDRGRRYETAASLAEDVRRHLENQPVRARRPSLSYRGGKFARRHRAGLLLAGSALVIGVVGWKFWPIGTSAGTLPRNAAVAANKVGPRGNPNAIDITGNRDFSAGAIREGLGHDDSFIQAAHPEAPLDELVAVTRQAILRGYRSLGYLHAAAIVTHNPDQARLKAAITEGRRYRRGEVQVRGLTEADSAQVIQLLTRPPPLDEAERAEEAVTSFMTQEAEIQQGLAQIESLISDTPAGLRAVSKMHSSANAPTEVFVTPSSRPRHALWERETPAPFTSDYLQEVVSEVRVWLDRKGFSTAEIQAEVQPDESSGLATLQVRIQEGTRAVLGAVTVTGNQRNTAEEIIRCTGLTLSRNLDADAIARARLALWNSARFYAFSLRARSTPADGGVCAVEIDVSECEAMPPLRESLSRPQQALVRFANWVTTETRRREFKLTLGDPGISVVMTPEKGSAVYTEDPKTGALLALLIRPGGIRLFGTSDAGTTGLDICRLAIRPTAFLHIFTTRGPERHGNMTMGMGLTREPGPGNPRDPDGFSVVLAPLVACKDLAAHAEPAFADGDVILRIENEGNATTLRFREDTGALVSMDKMQLKEMQVAFHVGGNDFARVTQRADQEWSRLPFDPAQRMSLAELLLHTGLRKQFAKTDVPPPDLLRAAVFLRVSERLLATPEFRSWLNPASLRDDPPFTIPEDMPHGMPTGDVMASLGRNLHQFVQIFTPTQAWPARLMREIPYLIEGRTERSAAMFNNLRQDPDMGPIGSLLTAKLMLQFNQPEAWRFARRAVDHGSTEEFRQDYHTLLEGDSTVARMIQTALPALASLSNEEMDQIIAGWPEAEAKLWRQAVILFRGMKAEGVVSALRPELESWWAQEMQPHLTERIGRFLEPGEPIPALVAATVNGRAIRRSVLAAVRRNPRLLSVVPPGIPAANAGPSGADPAFENLVLLTLVREEAVTHGADDSATAIDRRLEQIIREQFHDDRHGFETMLGREGLSVDDFRQLTRLNDASAGLVQSTGQPEQAQPRQRIADHLRGLRDAAFVRMIPEPAQSPAH